MQNQPMKCVGICVCGHMWVWAYVGVGICVGVCTCACLCLNYSHVVLIRSNDATLPLIISIALSGGTEYNSYINLAGMSLSL